MGQVKVQPLQTGRPLHYNTLIKSLLPREDWNNRFLITEKNEPEFRTSLAKTAQAVLPALKGLAVMCEEISKSAKQNQDEAKKIELKAGLNSLGEKMHADIRAPITDALQLAREEKRKYDAITGSWCLQFFTMEFQVFSSSTENYIMFSSKKEHASDAELVRKMSNKALSNIKQIASNIEKSGSDGGVALFATFLVKFEQFRKPESPG